VCKKSEGLAVPNPQDSTFNVQPPPNPAELGNGRALKHGAFSDSLVNPRARELAEQVLDANRHLDARRDGPTILRYATALARCERVYCWLAVQEDDTFADLVRGTTHTVLDRLRKWEAQCDSAERALAIQPLVRAKLGLTVAQALDAASLLSAAREEPDVGLRRSMLEAGGLIEVSADD
jgi:hypothetical protein